METTSIQLLSAARFLPKRHSRTASRSPTRPRLIDDILSDLSPQTTLEAFTSASGTLKASIENASPTQRAFGIRAAIASNKIHQWVDELASWPWPAGSCQGFEIPVAKRRKLSNGNRREDATGNLEDTIRDEGSALLHDDEYWGCLPAQDVIRYEARVDEILEDMEDLDVEEIKRQILDTHILPKTRPSSSLDQQPETLSTLPYTAMDDFTAIVTATVLQALPKLSRLMELMSMWSVRLSILRQVPPFMTAMSDTEAALKQEWERLRVISSKQRVKNETISHTENPTLPRLDLEVMRELLQDKVGILGRQIDQMLDSLEGRQETLPEVWLDRMEAIEIDYGEWSVLGEKLVREGEWAKDAARQLEKEKVNTSTVAEVHVAEIKDSPILIEHDQQLTQQSLPVAGDSAQYTTNDQPKIDSSAERVAMLPPEETLDKKEEISPHFESGSNLSTPITPRSQTLEIMPPVQSQPSKINGKSPPTGSQQINGSVPSPRPLGPSETETRSRRGRPFQAGFSWYLTHGEEAVGIPSLPSINPIAGVLALPSEPSLLDGTEGTEEFDKPIGKGQIHDSPKDVVMHLKSTVKKGEVNAGEDDSMAAKKSLSRSDFAPLVMDDWFNSHEDVPADLSSSTDGTFEEVGHSKFNVLNETLSSPDHYVSETFHGLSSSPRPKAGAIESYPIFIDGQPPDGGVTTPSGPARIPRFGSGIANSLRREVHPMVLHMDDEIIRQRSLSSGKNEIPRNREVGMLVRPTSSPNGSKIAAPVDGQTPSGVVLPPVSCERVPDVYESGHAQNPTNQLTENLLMEVAPTEQSREEFHSIKLTKPQSSESSADLRREQNTPSGSNTATVEPVEVSILAGDKKFDFSETMITSTGDSGAETQENLAATNNSMVQGRLDLREVVEAVFSEEPPANSADSVVAPKSTLPFGAISDGQIHNLTKIEASEFGQLVPPAPFPTDSKESDTQAISTAPIMDSPPPKERPQSPDPSSHVLFNNEPASDDLLVAENLGPRHDLPMIVASRTGDAESISKPLAITSPGPQVHEPLDNNILPQSNSVSVATSPATPKNLDVAEVLTASIPAILPAQNFLPFEKLPAESDKEPYKKPFTPTTPISAISDQSTSNSTQEILVAEHAEHFRPISAVEIGHVDPAETASIITPTEPTFEAASVTSDDANSGVTEIDGTQTANSGTSASNAQPILRDLEIPHTSSLHFEVAIKNSDNHDAEDLSHSHKSSLASVFVQQSNDDLVGTPPEDSSSAFSPTTDSVAATPLMVLSPDTIYQSPAADGNSAVSLIEYDEDSPSIRRTRPQDEMDDYSPPGSPLPELHISKYRLPPLEKSFSIESDSSHPDGPERLAEAPLLSNVEVSPAPPPSNLMKTSDDQLQQQISEILESIPARIKLTSEPETSRISRIPKLKKQISRASLNPHPHPPFSRAPTPSFTLAPAYAKNPRPRPQNGNPEIKLYHLSRSNGEAPIKLFVRLVGENGERVMVRVGGGWADLGEYLKEYANHHGRRSDKEEKVEIQDLPSRVVSSGFNASTVRNGAPNRSGTCSPVSRPKSSLDRPMSSLAVRKTRKSVGEDARERSYRSPSTPLTNSFRGSPTVPRALETPPSATSRSVSRMSWTEDESALGLAGPKSRKVEISAENAAWVESMKEKVRIASAEKEKEKKPDFGEMDRVGATKRLFKKGG